MRARARSGESTVSRFKAESMFVLCVRTLADRIVPSLLSSLAEACGCPVGRGDKLDKMVDGRLEERRDGGSHIHTHTVVEVRAGEKMFQLFGLS